MLLFDKALRKANQVSPCLHKPIRVFKLSAIEKRGYDKVTAPDLKPAKLGTFHISQSHDEFKHGTQQSCYRE